MKSKLFLLLFIPLVALLSLIGNSAFQKYSTEQAMMRITAAISMAVDSGHVIHELQKERGLSAGFIASTGKKFAAELPTQRSMSTQAVTQFAEHFANFKQLYSTSLLNAEFSKILTQLQSLQSLHNQVDSLTSTSAEVIAHYSQLILQVQKTLEGILEECNEVALFQDTSNYLDLITGKEFAGQERATLNAALSTGTFNPALYRSWVERMALQKDHLATFITHAHAAQKRLFDSLIAPKLSVVEDFRTNALQSLTSERLNGDPQAWFAASTAYINTLRELELMVGRDLTQLAVGLESKARQALYTTLGLGFCVLLITLVLALAVVRNITVPLAATVSFALNVAAGRLDHRLHLVRRDELGRLSTALNDMLDALKAMIAKADASSNAAQLETEKAVIATQKAEEAKLQAENAKREGMQAAAMQLSQVVRALATSASELTEHIALSDQGSRDQSSSMSETAIAMEEMNITVLEVAKNSINAATTADNTKQQAKTGSTMVESVIGAMGNALKNTQNLKTHMARLGERAEEIGKVLSVISDIADQTNLLALNAAIEAARAGESGRGFAVVADEVRKLAEKTMTATRQVNEVVKAIQEDTHTNITAVEMAVQDMDATTASAQESGKALDGIVALVDQVTDQIRSIATAAEQQSATSEEITRNITDVNVIAQHTATTMTHASNAVGNLGKQVRVVEQLIVDLQK